MLLFAAIDQTIKGAITAVLMMQGSVRSYWCSVLSGPHGDEEEERGRRLAKGPMPVMFWSQVPQSGAQPSEPASSHPVEEATFPIRQGRAVLVPLT